MYSKDKD